MKNPVNAPEPRPVRRRVRRRLGGGGSLGEVGNPGPLPLLKRSCFFRGGHRIVSIHPCNKARADLGGTDRFAFVMVPAIAEPGFIHLPDHVQNTPSSFRLTLRENAEM